MTTTRVALVGMGKMGRAVAALAAERQCAIVAEIDAGTTVSREALGEADVAIEFTVPEAAEANVRGCLAAGCPVVSGTTGWGPGLAAVSAEVQAGEGALLWASNFSVGVNLFFGIARHAARLLGEQLGFDAHLVETHHAAKRDAPSGTAVTLASIVGETAARSVPVTSVRTGHVPGTHTLLFDAPFEQITIEHVARDRRVFADGALLAARWLAARAGAGERGLFTMADVLSRPIAS